MNKSVKKLRMLSKISFIFAFIIVFTKVILQPEYIGIFTFEFSFSALLALIINILYNFLIFYGISVLFTAIADLLEKHQE